MKLLGFNWCLLVISEIADQVRDSLLIADHNRLFKYIVAFLICLVLLRHYIKIICKFIISFGMKLLEICWLVFGLRSLVLNQSENLMVAVSYDVAIKPYVVILLRIISIGLRALYVYVS